MTKRFATSLLLLLIVCSIASAVRVERLIDTWQPKHYVVSLTLNDRLSEIVSGSARIDVLVLNAGIAHVSPFAELATA